MRSELDQILAALAAEFATGQMDDWLTAQVAALANPTDLVYRSVSEGLAGIVYRRLKKTGRLEALGTQLARRLTQTHYHAVQNELCLRAALVDLAAHLTNSRVPAVFLKGMALPDDLYVQPGLRPLYDIDMWVLPKDFKAFSKLLQACGYSSSRRYPQTFKKGNTVVDIHTHLLWADRIAARQHLLAVDQARLFHEAETFRVGNQTAWRLNRYDQVLYLWLHALKHNLERLVWLLDIRLLLDRFDADDWWQLIERAGLLGQSRALAQLLFLLDEFWALNFPDVTRRFQEATPISGLEKRLLRRRKHQGALPQWSTLVLFPAGMQHGKGRLIWETFFPRPDIIRQGFPDAVNLPAWRLYARRVMQLATVPLKKGI